MNDDLGVRSSAEAVSRRNQLAPQRLVIVDFAIEHDPARVVFVGHRLTPADPVDDRETAVSDRRMEVGVVPLSIRTPMHERSRHWADGSPNGGVEHAIHADYPCQATHLENSPDPAVRCLSDPRTARVVPPPTRAAMKL